MKTAFILMIASTTMAAGAAVIMMKYLGDRANQDRVHKGRGNDTQGDGNMVPVADVASIFAGTSLRLQREIAALSRRGNLNLTIGVITTGFAVGLLAYMVMNEEEVPGDLAAVISHYIPRISTVSFIEVFSYFFLRLYRASLAEIKFYQNELTALASQQIALDASRSVDPAALRATLDQIARHNPNAVPSSSLQPTAYSLDSDPRLKLALELVDRVTTLAVVGAKARSAV
jgi:hypothetical protein